MISITWKVVRELGLVTDHFQMIWYPQLSNYWMAIGRADKTIDFAFQVK